MKTDISFHSVLDYGGDAGMDDLLTGYGWRSVSRPEDARIIIFNGGADIGTNIYGEIPLYGGIPYTRSNRDSFEIELFEDFPDTFKLGICRGAQLLNCLNGGTLWQDVNNHGESHIMTDLTTNQKLRVTSTHHQMMRPNYSTGLIIGVADESTRKDAEKDHYPFQSFKDDHQDTEIVWYKDTRTLCVQGHPEYVPNSEFSDYTVSLIKRYL